MDFVIAKTKEQIAFCKDVLFAFRPKLDEATYIDQIMAMISDEKFKLVYISSQDKTRVTAFIGYRFMNSLRTNRMIYIDDLYTDPDYRGNGYASALLDYIDEEAIEGRIISVHLDSAYILHDAHRLYLNKGYVLACNHFAKEISVSG